MNETLKEFAAISALIILVMNLIMGSFYFWFKVMA